MDKKLGTLQIFPGPEYRSSERLHDRFLALSKHNTGTVITISSVNDTFYVGEFKFVFLANSRSILGSLKFLLSVLKEAKILKKKKSLDLVVCYDALKIGAFGYIVKLLFGAKLLVEINSEVNSKVLFEFKAGLKMRLKKKFYPMVQKFIIRRADGVKCLFEGQIKNIETQKSTVIESFFDHSPIERGKYSAISERKILSMGFPSYIKGFDILIEAFIKISNKFPHWNLEIVGWFDKHDLEQLSKIISGCTQITISKPISLSEVPSKIDSCSLFVLASRSEGMGRVLVEAMARGRARVGANVGGIPSVIDDGVDGLLFESENVDDLADKLINLLSSEAKRERLAVNGLARFEREFTLENYASRASSLYHKVASK